MSTSNNSSTDIKPKYKFSIMGVGRWEDRDLCEWVEYHRSLGFDHVYFYSNDDDPSLCAKALFPYLCGPDPFVTLKHYPKRYSSQVQKDSICFHFLRHFKSETEWFSIIDIDEFFVFKNKNNVKEFMRDFEDIADSVYFNWVIYGHSYKTKRNEDLIILSHTRRSENIDCHTKNITRSSSIDVKNIIEQHRNGNKSAFYHFWDRYNIPGFRPVNVIRDDMSGYAEDFPKNALEYVRKEGVSGRVMQDAYVAHYQFKSAEDFARRVARGGSHSVTYWAKAIEGGNLDARLAPANRVWDTYIADYWLRHIGSGLDIVVEQPVPTGRRPNIALHKPTLQSSVHVPEEGDPPNGAVQGHGNDGVRSGTYGFRTKHEDAPWWTVDLLAAFDVAEFHIYNRMDNEAAVSQANHISVLVSADMVEWTEVYRYSSDIPFGGIGSKPLVIKLATPSRARYVRLKSNQPATLHLDEVEVYEL